jgi:hypothetical protein
MLPGIGVGMEIKVLMSFRSVPKNMGSVVLLSVLLDMLIILHNLKLLY